jgi:phosphoribosylamine--glycine ligase
MIFKNEPYLIEYNVRMGDPECQTILPKLKSDISDIFLACCDQKLNKIQIEWHNKKSLCVVVCSKGYPDTFLKNVEIKNLGKLSLNKNEFLFHAGTMRKDKNIFAIGGRVLNLVNISDDFKVAQKNIYKNLKKLNWSEGFYRKDIGFKVIDK